MRGDVVYRIYGVHAGREEDSYFGTFRTRPEAVAKIAELRTREMNGRNWAEQYHNRGFDVRETRVDTDFEIPPLPKPRDQYAVKGTPRSNGPGVLASTVVEVFRRDGAEGEPAKVAEYLRNYSLLQTFEPFRQGGRDYALISRNNTQTAVLDLATGHVIAEETDTTGFGFCPVGFYVPDWWDVNADSSLPGSKYWNADKEWPTGDFGFVWGCVWGDDSSWKVQHLDLSAVHQCVIRRDDRFGYVELATAGFDSPCLALDTEPSRTSEPPHFITVSRWRGVPRVSFAVEMLFGLESGKPEEWERQRITNME